MSLSLFPFRFNIFYFFFFFPNTIAHSINFLENYKLCPVTHCCRSSLPQKKEEIEEPSFLKSVIQFLKRSLDKIVLFSLILNAQINIDALNPHYQAQFWSSTSLPHIQKCLHKDSFFFSFFFF